MIRLTCYVHLAPTAPPDAISQLVDAVNAGARELDVLALHAAPTAPVTIGGGELTFLAAFRDVDSCEAARRHPYVQATIRPLLDRFAKHVETVRYTQGPAIVQAPGIEGCVQRTLLMRIDPAADPDEILAFEQALADMTNYISAIRNSSLSRVDEVLNPTGPHWTHVWEQEFENLDDLNGPYMRHAYHWSYVDSWFDPQAPNHLVDTTLLHSACDLRRSILALARDANGADLDETGS